MSTPLPSSYPLTPTQHGMLFNCIQAPHSGVDLEQIVATLQHALDVPVFEAAWARVMQQHPVLHSRYAWEGLAEPRQEVVPELGLPFVLRDLADQPQEEQRATLADYLKSDRGQGFDLARGPLFRIALFRIANAEYRLVFSYSHSILDNCVLAVIREVFETYDRLRMGLPVQLTQRTPYREHVLWLQEHLAANRDAAGAFFRELLAGFTTRTKLAVERAAGATPLAEPGYGNHRFSVTRETSDAIRTLSRQHSLNPSVFVHAAWALVLSSFSGDDDVVFGDLRECRRTSVPGATETVGLFINTLPVRADVSPGTPLLTLLERLRQQQLAVRNFEQTPLVDVQAVAEVPRGTPLFETIVIYNRAHNNTTIRSWGGDFEQREFDFIHQTSFPLSLLAYADDTIHFKLSYDPGRFEPAAALRMCELLSELLTQMAHDVNVPLAQLPHCPVSERALVLKDWNQTSAPYQRQCIHRLFEAQVERSPEHTALAFRDQTMSYARLNAHANVLARRLAAQGVGPNVLVGVFVERGFEMMVALLAVLKAGGAYVPMDPSYPRERLAMMLEDARAPIVLTLSRLAGRLPAHTAQVVAVDLAELARAAPADLTNPGSPVGADDLAYVIFTSGSTGRPKGVMIEHGNVANFFAAMDARIGAEQPGVWLALTSISFDISVLELFWTLARGFTVVVQESIDELALSSPQRARSASSKPMDFSLFYFAADSGKAGKAQYRLLIEGAKYADQNGFAAIWTPERHFHAFGGLYPNPALTSAAIAMVTERIQLRAGSVVLPLHNPIRCAEEWSVVDNLSEGRVGLSFASGWHASDFALAPDNFTRRRELMWEGIETVRALFRGEEIETRGGDGIERKVKMYPPSVQKEPKIWITAGGSPETFTMAGKLGASILTNLLVMKPEELVENIRIYRAAFAAAGHAGEGHVTLMLHTFVGHDVQAVRERVRGPFMEYLRTSTDLINKARWELTSFAREKPGAATGSGSHDLGELSPAEMDAMMAHAFERYFATTGLFGTPASCLAMVEQLKEIGVSEIACLVDFGVDEDAVLDSLVQLNELRKLSNGAIESTPGDYSIAAQMRRYGVTHLQCTPSLAGMLAADSDALAALGTLRKLMLGGEALPTTLLERLAPVLSGQLLNMYGPTETTIWSTTAALALAAPLVTLGRPIANTEVFVASRSLSACPVGVPGELLIGGHGVARGYLDRPELSAERFISNPFRADSALGSERLYRTGDLVRWLPSGELDFLGRLDHQVKIRGYRIELGEIESLITRHPAVAECVVVARAPEAAAGDSRLVAYVIPVSEQPASKSQASPVFTGDWQAVWNETYLGSGAGPSDAAFDISGWASSYTGQPIPADEMREWVEHTVTRILALAPRHVLELGCGTGLLLYRVAPHVQHYTGLDFSPAALAGIASELEKRALGNVTLVEKRADQAGELEPRAYDTVVLNSVLQYFPDVAYFVRVVQDVLGLLAPGGTFFVGDVRSLPLLEAFHTAIELERASADLPCTELRARIERRLAEERELLLSPALFSALQQQIPEIAEVSVQLKSGAAHNELTRFRYDVVIRKRAGEQPTFRTPVAFASAAELPAALAGGAALVSAAEQLNARLVREVQAVELLRGSLRGGTVAQLRQALAALPTGLDPATTLRHVREGGASDVSISWAASGALDRFDVLAAGGGRVAPGAAPAIPTGTPWEAYANRPVRVQRGEALPSELRAHLRERLPEFMVPGAFVLLDSFPLTPNGKIDRNALPEPDRSHRASSQAYTAPASELEHKIAGVWQALLGLDHVGTRDNFFELGANSFLMVQASTRLRDALGISISLVDLFQYPSVSALATRVGDSPREELAAQEGKDRAQARAEAMQRRRGVRARS